MSVTVQVLGAGDAGRPPSSGRGPRQEASSGCFSLVLAHPLTPQTPFGTRCKPVRAKWSLMRSFAFTSVRLRMRDVTFSVCFALGWRVSLKLIDWRERGQPAPACRLCVGNPSPL